MPLDGAVDRMGVEYISHCLPPYFTAEEAELLSAQDPKVYTNRLPT